MLCSVEEFHGAAGNMCKSRRPGVRHPHAQYHAARRDAAGGLRYANQDQDRTIIWVGLLFLQAAFRVALTEPYADRRTADVGTKTSLARSKLGLALKLCHPRQCFYPKFHGSRIHIIKLSTYALRRGPNRSKELLDRFRLFPPGIREMALKFHGK